MNKNFLKFLRIVLYALITINIRYETGWVTMIAMIVVFACIEFDFIQRVKIRKSVEDLDGHLKHHFESQEKFKEEALKQLADMLHIVNRRSSGK